MALVGATGKRQARLPLSLLIPLFPQKTVESIWDWTKAFAAAMTDMYNKLVNRIEELIQYGTTLPPSDGGRKIFWQTDLRKLYMDIQTGDTTKWELILAGSNAELLDSVADWMWSASVAGANIVYNGANWEVQEEILVDYVNEPQALYPMENETIDLGRDPDHWWDNIWARNIRANELHSEYLYVSTPPYVKKTGFDGNNTHEYMKWTASYASNDDVIFSLESWDWVGDTSTDAAIFYWSEGERRQIDGSSWDEENTAWVTRTYEINVGQTSGVYRVFFDLNDSELQSTTDSIDFSGNSKCYIASIVIDDADNILAVNYEGFTWLMSPEAKDLSWNRTGSVVSGLEATADTVSVYVSDGSMFVADLSIPIVNNSGTFFDQPISPLEAPKFYRTATGWHSSFSVKKECPLVRTSMPNKIKFSEYAGGNYTLTAVSTGWYAASWVVATNNYQDPIVYVPGVAQASTIAECRNANLLQNFDWTDFPATARKVIARTIVTTSVGDPYYSVVAIDDFRSTNEFEDGLHTSYLFNASNIESGVLAVEYGGTENTSFATGEILFGNDTGPISTDSTFYYSSGTLVVDTASVGTLTVNDTTVVTNLNADMVDGEHATAFATADHTHSDYVEIVDSTYVTTGNTNWIDLTDAGQTTLHSHAPGDADTLDGSHANAFATAAHTHTTFASLTIGGVTSYTSVDTSGHMTMYAYAKPWEDLRIEPVIRGSGVQVPSFEKWYDDVAGTSRGVYLYSFDDVHVANQEKEIHFTMQMPHAWDQGAISIHVHWVPFATENATDVEWGLEYAWKEPGAVFGDTAIIYSSLTLLPDDANITIGKHYISEFADISPDSTQDGLSSILIGRLFRHSTGGNDTYTNKVGLLYIDAHYQLNSLGSNDEYLK